MKALKLQNKKRINRQNVANGFSFIFAFDLRFDGLKSLMDIEIGTIEDLEIEPEKVTKPIRSKDGGGYGTGNGGNNGGGGGGGNNQPGNEKFEEKRRV